MPAKSNRESRGAQYSTRKGTRRIPVTIKWLRWSGIQRGDKATVAMTGDVRVGELGYFSIWGYQQAYKQLRFVYEQDDECRLSHPSTCTPGGICLRERRGIDGFARECTGDHDGLAYGRICAVERDGRPIETKLTLRPYDEREGPATTRLDMNAEAPPKEDDGAEADTRAAKLNTKLCQAIAERLRAVYTDRRSLRGDLNRLSRRLFQLAARAGIKGARSMPCALRHELFLRAVEAGHAASPETEELLNTLGRVERSLAYGESGPTPATVKAATDEKPRLHPKTRRCDIKGCTSENVGFTYGEVVEVTEADDLRPGEIAAVNSSRIEYAIIGRVVEWEADHIIVKDEEGAHFIPREELEYAGRVNPEPVGRWDGPDEEARQRIKQLRAKLEALNGEDDQILRCTARYEIEKEIFDIEHPAQGDSDDWSAWEEKGEA